MTRILFVSLAAALVLAACSAASSSEDPGTAVETPSTSIAPVTSLPPATTTTTTTAPTTTTTLAPPSLITVPADGQAVDRYSFDFVGSTEPGVVVTVNDEPVDVDADGNFSFPVVSDLGTNTVTVTLDNGSALPVTSRISYEFAPEDGWVAAIGDSVMLGSAAEIELRLGDGIVDATVSRQFLDAPTLVAELVARPEPPQVIIVGLGTNGPAQERHFDQVMEAAGEDRLMVFVNVHVPRSWEEDTNRTLAEGVERYDNAVLVDWAAATEGRDDLFAADGFHPKQPGRVIMADLIAEAIFPNWVSQDEG